MDTADQRQGLGPFHICQVQGAIEVGEFCTAARDLPFEIRAKGICIAAQKEQVISTSEMFRCGLGGLFSSREMHIAICQIDGRTLGAAVFAQGSPFGMGEYFVYFHGCSDAPRGARRQGQLPSVALSCAVEGCLKIPRFDCVEDQGFDASGHEAGLNIRSKHARRTIGVFPFMGFVQSAPVAITLRGPDLLGIGHRHGPQAGIARDMASKALVEPSGNALVPQIAQAHMSMNMDMRELMGQDRRIHPLGANQDCMPAQREAPWFEPKAACIK